jgi:hypothetical protein
MRISRLVWMGFSILEMVMFSKGNIQYVIILELKGKSLTKFNQICMKYLPIGIIARFDM